MQSGYFDAAHFNEAPAAIKPFSHGPGQWYVTINPVNPALQARSANKLKRTQKGGGTSDKDILRRRWFPIDFDPVRPTGVSSTDAEKAASWETLQALRDWLRKELGFSDPVVADSGNGYHALYSIDLPNDDASRGILEAGLQVLSQRFSNNRCKVDETMFNAARIIKLYGTVAKKGDHFPSGGRPHRLARLIEAPEAWELEDNSGHLRALAAMLKPSGESKPSGSGNLHEKIAWARAFIDRNNIAIEAEYAKDDKFYFELEACPFNQEHKKAAICVAQNGLGYHCFHDSCRNKKWEEFRALYEKPNRSTPVEDFTPDSGLYFDQNGQFRPTALADEIMRRQRFARQHQDLFVYRDGVYAETTQDYVKSLAKSILLDRYRDARGTEVARQIMTSTYNPKGFFIDDREELNVANGILAWRTGRLRDHTPDYPSRVQLPVVFDPRADCPRIKKYFSEVLHPDCIELAAEIFGYALIPDTSMQKAFLLKSGGESGKSIFLFLLEAFLGSQNVSHEKLHDISENRFRSEKLHNKLANIFADLPATYVSDSSTFKALVTGDPISAEKKGQTPFTFRNHARLIFSANLLPHSADTTHGYFRRWVLIHFPNTFPEGSPLRDERLLEKLTTPEELSGLLNLALVGLRRLKARGHFDTPPSCRAELEEYKRLNDSVVLFSAEHITTEDPAGEVGRVALYSQYKVFCWADNLKPVSSQKFCAKIREQFPTAREAKKRGEWFWTGLRCSYSEF